MSETTNTNTVSKTEDLGEYLELEFSQVDANTNYNSNSITYDSIKTIAKNTNAVIIAFALETSNGKQNALEKLKDKGADYIVLNHPMDDGCGIESNYNKVSIFSKNNDQFDIKKDRKDSVAKQILEFINSKQA